MDEFTEFMSKILINDFEQGTEHWVDVTHINDPHNFYVRPTIYRKYMAALEAPGHRVNSNEIYKGKTIVFKSKKLKKYVRGEICFFEDKDGIKCDIFAPDIGMFEKSISIRRVYECCNHTDVPGLITHCQLADCKPMGEKFTKDVTDTMKLYVGEERAKMVVRGRAHGKLIVELINSCPDDIATMLALVGETTLGYDCNVVSKIKVPPIA